MSPSPTQEEVGNRLLGTRASLLKSHPLPLSWCWHLPSNRGRGCPVSRVRPEMGVQLCTEGPLYHGALFSHPIPPIPSHPSHPIPSHAKQSDPNTLHLYIPILCYPSHPLPSEPPTILSHPTFSCTKHFFNYRLLLSHLEWMKNKRKSFVYYFRPWGNNHALFPKLVWTQLSTSLGVGQRESWRMWLRGTMWGRLSPPSPHLPSRHRGAALRARSTSSFLLPRLWPDESSPRASREPSVVGRLWGARWLEPPA